MKMNKRKREILTVRLMIQDYCRKNHLSEVVLCPDCEMLLDYAVMQINSCKLGDQKSTCAKCAIHCFEPGYREKIRKVMRFTGPRMLFKHPILALQHLIDSGSQSARGPSQ